VLDEDGVHGYHGVEQAGRHSSLPFLGAILDGKKEKKKSRDATTTTTRVTDGYYMIQHSRPTHTHTRRNASSERKRKTNFD
jgi:hypothetical protein